MCQVLTVNLTVASDERSDKRLIWDKYNICHLLACLPGYSKSQVLKTDFKRVLYYSTFQILEGFSWSVFIYST